MKHMKYWIAACLTGLLAMGVAPRAHAVSLGLNAGYAEDWAPGLIFADAVKLARGWGPIGSEWTDTAAKDANGWPTTDAGTILSDAGDDLSGTYALSFTGSAATTVSAYGPNSYTVTVGAPDGNGVRSGTIVVPSGATNLWIDFANTTGGVKNVKIMRPTSPGASTSFPTTQVFTQQYLNAYQRFSTIRTMELRNTNLNAEVNWSDRRLPGNSYQTSASGNELTREGVAWEYVVALANATGKDIWINVPGKATDAYVTSLANLFKYGSDGVNAYTSTQSNPVYAPLNSNLHVYVEYANEVFNTGSGFTISYNYNNQQATADGITPVQEYGKRAAQIATDFKNVWGAGAMNNQVRMVLTWQENLSPAGAAFGSMLQYINDHFAVPNTLIWAICSGEYFEDCINYTPGASDSVATILADLQTNIVGNDTFTTSILAAAATWGVKYDIYEGGPDSSASGTVNTTNRLAAETDPGMTAIVQSAVNSYFWAKGGDLYNYYEDFDTYGSGGSFGLSQTPYNQTTSKWLGIQGLAGVPVSGLTAINTAGPAASPFVADAGFSGGTTATNWTGAIDTSAVTSPAPQAVYQSERYGVSTYVVSGLTAGTSYTVRLHFCENYWTATGKRVFNVSINGTPKLTNFDIFATAGAAHKANIQQFTVAANSSGQEIINFTNVTDNALINGIEVKTASSPPAAPTGLTATGSNSQVALSWTASSGATSYNVLRSTVSGSGYASVATGISTTTYTNTGLTNGTTYYFVVTATNANGTSGNSNQASATPQVGAPPAPTGLTATPGNAQIALSWTASSGATSYSVYRGTAAGGESGTAIVTGVSTTSYTNTGLTNGTHYYYTVKAVNAGGTSGASNEANATPTASTDTSQFNFESGIQGWVAQGAPVTAVAASTAHAFLGTQSLAVTINGTGNGQASISAPGVPAGATITYHVWIPSGSQITAVQPYVQDQAWVWTGTGVAIGSLTLNAWNTITVTVPANAAMPLQVCGVEFSLGATWSGTCYIDSVSWPSSAPAAPTGLTATPGNAQIALSWTASSGATSYSVYRGTTAGGESGTAIATGISTTTYTNTGLTNGTHYYYTVKAVNSSGTSGASNEANATPAGDTSQYNFESGVQGWVSNGAPITGVATSTAHAYLGTQSLAVSISGAGTNHVYVSNPGPTAGKTVTYHVWIPSGSTLNDVQAFIFDQNWTWTGDYVLIANLTTNAWNTFTIPIPSTAVLPLQQLGVEFDTNTAWTGTCYVDSVSW